MRPTPAAFRAVRPRAPAFPSPRAPAKSPSVPTPEVRCAFRHRSTVSSASSRRRGVCRSPARSRCPATLDSIGPLARTVAECAAADAVMAGEEPSALAPLSLAGLRIGIPRGVLFEDTEDEVATAFERCLGKIELSGRAHRRPVDRRSARRDARRRPSEASIAAMEGAEVHADWLATGASMPVDPHVSGPLSRAATFRRTIYIRAIRRRAALAAAMDERLASVDVLALPTTPMTAPTIASMTERRSPARPDRRPAAAQHTGRQPVRPLRDLAADAGNDIAGRADAGGAQRP